MRRACKGCGATIAAHKRSNAIWCSDYCRKMQYSHPCVDCGGPTSYGTSKKVSERCSPCALRYHHESRGWPPERIIGAIREWADEHGGIPPRTTDWNFANKSSRWPWTVQVQQEFGSWAKGIRAAGFAPHLNHPGTNCSAADILRTAELHRQGMPVKALAKRYGVTPAAIHRRLRRARELRAAA